MKKPLCGRTQIRTRSSISDFLNRIVPSGLLHGICFNLVLLRIHLLDTFKYPASSATQNE